MAEINPWNNVKKRRGKLVGMLTDKLAKNSMIIDTGLRLSTTGLKTVRLRKPSNKKL